MDILAHTLWASALAKEANSISEKKNSAREEEGEKFHISVGWAAFWGIFPDLFAFSLPFILRFYYILAGDGSFSVFFVRSRGGVGGAEDGFDIARILYQYSHSLVIWAIVFLVVWAIFRRPRFELLAWALHILIDIPTHVLAFYPTPFLFPISDYKFPYGVSWGTQWFMIVNYSALAIVWIRILLTKKKTYVSKLPN